MARESCEVSLLKQSVCSKEADLFKFKELNITCEFRQQLRDDNLKKSSEAPEGAEKRGVGLEGRQETLRKVLETIGEKINPRDMAVSSQKANTHTLHHLRNVFNCLSLRTDMICFIFYTCHMCQCTLKAAMGVNT